MILIGHAIIGAALAVPLKNPYLAFFVALVSHFALDAIPHYEYSFEYLIEKRGKRRLWVDLTKIILDGILAVTSALLIFSPTDFAGFTVTFAAIVGGLLPDFMQGVYVIWPVKPVAAFYNFHYAVHSKYDFEDHPVIGIALQLLIVGLFLWYGLSFL